MKDKEGFITVETECFFSSIFTVNFGLSYNYSRKILLGPVSLLQVVERPTVSYYHHCCHVSECSYSYVTDSHC